MNVRDYLRASVGDFAVCWVIAAALGFVNCGAFYVEQQLQYSLPALAVCAGLPLLVLFFAAYKRMTVAIGTAVLVAGVALACGVSAHAAGIEYVFQDTEGNPAVFVIVVAVGSVTTFLMTRRRWLSRLFLLAVIVDICFVEFMYKQYYAPALLVALIAAGVMVVYRNYRNNLRDASTDKVSFLRAVAVGLIYAGVLVGIACALFFLVIAPLNPGAFEIKIFPKYMNYEQVDRTGVRDTTTVDNPDETSNDTNDERDETDQESEQDANQLRGLNSQMTPEDETINGETPVDDTGENLLVMMFNFLVRHPNYLAVSVVLLLLLIAAPFVIKKRLRTRWFAKVCTLPPNEAVETFFMFCMKRFAILKITKPAQMTLAEFADTSRGALVEFAQNSQDVSFARITFLYAASVYGRQSLGEREVECCKAFYRTFYKAFAKKSGKVRYALRFFRV